MEEPSIINRVEEVLDNHLAPLQKQIEDEERNERIRQHLEELEEAKQMLQEKVLSRKKRDALMRKTKSLSKALERAKKRDEKKETTTTTTKRRGRKRKVGRGKEKVKPEETEEDLEERLKKIKMEAEEEEPLLAIEQSKSPKKSPKKTNHKVAQKMDDLSDLKAGDCVMIDPSDLDHSILPETRPLIARIIEVNMEDEYVRAEWMAMKASSIGKMLYEYKWEIDKKCGETPSFCVDDIFEKVDFRKGRKLSQAASARCESYYPNHEFDC